MKVTKALHLLTLTCLFLNSFNVVPAQASAPLPAFVSISSGFQYSCALTSEASVYCWGKNVMSQQGRSDWTNSLSPGLVSNLPKALKVKAGYQHTCAIVENKLVMCWGDNSSGQVGDGRMENGPRWLPVVVHNVFNTVDIALGKSHSCALSSSGEVKCWGGNQFGQLGISSNKDLLLPTVVQFPNPVRSIAAGDNHTCAVDIAGFVYCWGTNLSGQLGLGDRTSRNAPTLVTSISQATSVVAGFDSSCARFQNGSYQCWGEGSSGQLGNADLIDQPLPVSLASGSGSLATTPVVDVREVSLGAFHSCLIDVSSFAWCWGKAGDNLLGWGDSSAPSSYTLGTYTTYRSWPTAVMANISQIAAGADHTCLLRINGTIYCWGDNSWGQIGIGSTQFPNMPKTPLNGEIAPPSDVTWKIQDDKVTFNWTRDGIDYDWRTQEQTATSALVTSVIVSSEVDALGCSAVLLRTCSVGPIRPSTDYVFSIKASNNLGQSRIVTVKFTSPSSVSSQASKSKTEQDAQAKAIADAEAKAKTEAEAKAIADAEAKAKTEAEAKAIADAEAKAKTEAEAKAIADAEAKAKARASVEAEIAAADASDRLAEERAKEEQTSSQRSARQQSITVSEIAPQNLSVPFVVLKAQSSSGETILVTSVTPKICTGVSSIQPWAKLLRAGKCKLELSLAETLKYDASQVVQFNFDVVEDRTLTKIICRSGQLTKTVKAISPKCPAGFTQVQD